MEDVSTRTRDNGTGPAGFGLEKINLQVEAGDFCGILGANGSGKSTLARLCSWLVPAGLRRSPGGGYSTRDEQYRQKIRQTVGLVFQNPENQFVAETVTAETAFGLENLGIPPAEIRRRVREALDHSTWVTWRERRRTGYPRGKNAGFHWPPSACSAPRPAPGRAPEHAGPRKQKEDLLVSCRNCAGRGTALLWFTPAFTEVAAADHLLVLEEGKTAWQGRPEQVLG